MMHVHTVLGSRYMSARHVLLHRERIRFRFVTLICGNSGNCRKGQCQRLRCQQPQLSNTNFRRKRRIFFCSCSKDSCRTDAAVADHEESSRVILAVCTVDFRVCSARTKTKICRNKGWVSSSTKAGAGGEPRGQPSI